MHALGRRIHLCPACVQTQAGQAPARAHLEGIMGLPLRLRSSPSQPAVELSARLSHVVAIASHAQGTSGGLGSAIAEALALEGADVVCCHRDETDLAEAEKTAAAVVVRAGC
jgi:hypothetical protein